MPDAQNPALLKGSEDAKDLRTQIMIQRNKCASWVDPTYITYLLSPLIRYGARIVTITP